MKGICAYPSQPREIGVVIQETARLVPGLSTWEENDIPGRFIIEPILEQIETSDHLAADITRLNFNVSYEIGYAIGRQRRIFLLKSGAIKADDDLMREVGIFDQRVRVKSTNFARAIAIVKSPGDLTGL
jgi:hypothetical protein